MFSLSITLFFVCSIFFLLFLCFLVILSLDSSPLSSIFTGFSLAFSLDEPIYLTILRVRVPRSRLLLLTVQSWIKTLIPVPCRWIQWNQHIPPFPHTHTAIHIPTLKTSTGPASCDSIGSSSSGSSASVFPVSPSSLVGRPRSRRRPTLILDLDETLVHTLDRLPVSGQFDCRIEIQSKSRLRSFFILKRPGLDLFLQSLAPHYSLVLFTASVRRYADAVLDLVDPSKLIEKRFFRSSCLRQNGEFIKDLANVTRDLRRTIIVDNSPLAYSLHDENAVPIETWLDCAEDRELLDLIPFLIAIKNQEDIRTLLRRRKADNNQSQSAAKSDLISGASLVSSPCHLPIALQNHDCGSSTAI